MHAHTFWSLWCVLGFLVICRGAAGHGTPDPFSQQQPIKYIIGLDPTGNPPDCLCNFQVHHTKQGGQLPRTGLEQEDSDASTVEHVFMTDRAGITYDCRIPYASDPDDHSQRTKAASDQTTVAEILNALSARCFYRLEEWWTYELCYGKHVRQFHRDKDSLTAEYSLGTYAVEHDKLDDSQIVPSSDVGRSSYVQQSYLHGDDCDITGQTRQTEVRYSCAEGSKEMILSIKEPSTCQYVMTVGIPALCQHPAFKLHEDAVQHVVCTPVSASSLQAAPLAHGHQRDEL